MWELWFGRRCSGLYGRGGLTRSLDRHPGLSSQKEARSWPLSCLSLKSIPGELRSQASAVSHWNPETDGKSEIIKGREQRQQGPWGPGSSTSLVRGHSHKTNKEFISNRFSSGLAWVGKGVTVRLWYWAGWQTKTGRPRSQAAESLSCENSGYLGSRSLGEVAAKAVEGSWPLPLHDSASPVPRVTSPLPWPCGWWPWGWMCLPGDLELHGWVGSWTLEINSRVTLFESFWHWTGFYTGKHMCPNPTNSSFSQFPT